MKRTLTVGDLGGGKDLVIGNYRIVIKNSYDNYWVKCYKDLGENKNKYRRYLELQTRKKVKNYEEIDIIELIKELNEKGEYKQDRMYHPFDLQTTGLIAEAFSKLVGDEELAEHFNGLRKQVDEKEAKKIIKNIINLNNVLTFSEAAERWGLGNSTLREAARNKRFKEGEVRKSSSVWLVTESAMKRLYGEPKSQS